MTDLEIKSFNKSYTKAGDIKVSQIFAQYDMEQVKYEKFLNREYNICLKQN